MTSCSNAVFFTLEAAEVFWILIAITHDGSIGLSSSLDFLLFFILNYFSFDDLLVSLAIPPNALLDFSFLRDVGALAVHFTLFPATAVYSAVGPLVYADAISQIVYEVTFIFSTVRPGKHSLAMHASLDPLALVLPAILPYVDTHALDDIILKLSLVPVAVVPDLLSLAVLLAIRILALELRAIRPLLPAPAMLPVVGPLPLVLGPADPGVDPVAMRPVLPPLALVHVSIGVYEPSTACGFVLLELALVKGSIRPDLPASALPSVRSDDPLALVVHLGPDCS